MNTEALAERALRPLTKYAAKNRGTITLVADRLTKLNGSLVHRQLVEKWLHSDPKKRTQPLLGMGLMLMKVQDEICPAQTKK
jgi:hypothetical protein